MTKKTDTILFILGLILVSLFLVGIVNVFADNIIIFGKSTYEQVDDYIIFGSLGDEYSVSQFGKLGNNDWIPENSFKNILGYEGYSVAYDYNPTYDGYYSQAYNKPLPTGINLTKIQIAGLGANPRELQDVYVLSSEYNSLSAQGQAISIDNLNNGLSTETTDRKNGDNSLITSINNEVTTRANADNQLNSRIDDVSNRVSKLEKTQYKLQVEVRVFDSKKITITPYISQDFTRGVIDEAGVRITLKLGTSYEEREIAKTNNRLEKLETYLGTPEVKEAIQQVKMNKIKVDTDGRSFRIHKEF